MGHELKGVAMSSLVRPLVSSLRRSLKGRGLDALNALIAQIFSANEQGAIYIPRPVVNGAQVLFQDAAGTVPVTADGDPVGKMLDQSGNGNHATQSTSAKRPIYRTDGTLHWLEPDGVDDAMLATNQAFNLNVFTAAMAVKLSGTFNARVFDSRGTGAAGVVGFHIKPFNNNNNPFIDDGSGTDDLFSSIKTGTKVNLTQRNGVDPTILRENGEQTVSDNAPASGSILTSFDSVLFANSNGQDSQLFGGRFYGGLVVGRYADTYTDEQIESYLAGLSGVSL